MIRAITSTHSGAMSKWKMVEVAPFMWSLRNSITVSGVTSGPWMGMVTCLVSMNVYSVSLSAILVMKRYFPMPDRVELTTLTQELCVCVCVEREREREKVSQSHTLQ